MILSHTMMRTLNTMKILLFNCGLYAAPRLAVGVRASRVICSGIGESL